MKLRSLLLLAATAFSFQSFGQVWLADSVSNGVANPPSVPAYPLDVYYSLKNGIVKEDSNFKWHLAFDMSLPAGPNSYVGILANHVQAAVSVFSVHRPASDFNSYAAADTTGALTKQLYNADSNWHYGAFNVNRDPANLFDYGWGKYDISSHMVIGDSLFVVKVGSSTYKMIVENYRSAPTDSIRYSIRIANLDGSNDHTTKIYRNLGTDFRNRNFAYYNITNDAVIDREPSKHDWDMVFTRYIEPIAMGPGPKIPYPVAGVLTNLGVQVAEVRNLDPDTVTYQNYPYTKRASEIGSDWKRFDMSLNMYVMDTTLSYFIKSTSSQEYYHVKFTDFGGSANGKSVFAKKMVAVTSVKDVANNVATYALVPNPAVNDASLVADVKENSTAQLFVMDITGKVVHRSSVSLNKGMNAFKFSTAAYPAGTYIVTLTNGSWKITDKLIVQH